MASPVSSKSIMHIEHYCASLSIPGKILKANLGMFRISIGDNAFGLLFLPGPSESDPELEPDPDDPPESSSSS